MARTLQYEMQHLPLDAPAIGQTRKDDCRSSVDAAQTVDAQRQRDILHRELSGALDGLTADELAARTGWKREHISSRLAQMRRWGEAEDFGKRINDNNIGVKLWFAIPKNRSVVTQKVGSYL